MDANSVRGDQQLFALGRDAETTLATAAQAITEAGFQLGHLLADARLAQAQLTLRRAEAATFHDAARTGAATAGRRREADRASHYSWIKSG
jgi:hypothetical protein